MVEAGKNEAEAKAAAMKLSIENPDQYVTLYACFGIFVKVDKRLHVFAPTDSLFGAYWLNGKEKAFSDRQVARDSESTPICA